MRGRSESGGGGGSSGEEDGDAEWRKAISSVAAATSSYINGSSSSSSAAAAKQPRVLAADDDAGGDHRREQKPKHYQIKAQKLLDDILEKSLVMVRYDNDDDNDNDIHGDHTHVPNSDPLVENGGGIRLFKHSTPGFLLDHVDEPQQPRKRPKILPGEEIDEKSKKFKQRLRSVAVAGEDIMAAARKDGQKSLARLEAKEAAVKEAVEREEERVSELKKIRGERWLPSVAREKLKFTQSQG